MLQVVITEGCATQGDSANVNQGGKNLSSKCTWLHFTAESWSDLNSVLLRPLLLCSSGKEIDLSPGSPLVLTHKIKFVPSSSGSGSGPCGCEKDFAALRERLERLEREVSALREKCGGAEGSCCTSKESKGKTWRALPDQWTLTLFKERRGCLHVWFDQTLRREKDFHQNDRQQTFNKACPAAKPNRTLYKTRHTPTQCRTSNIYYNLQNYRISN